MLNPKCGCLDHLMRRNALGSASFKEVLALVDEETPFSKGSASIFARSYCCTFGFQGCVFLVGRGEGIPIQE
jgi:hypothetical protein